MVGIRRSGRMLNEMQLCLPFCDLQLPLNLRVITINYRVCAVSLVTGLILALPSSPRAEASVEAAHYGA
jgi:hypothetical protein